MGHKIAITWSILSDVCTRMLSIKLTQLQHVDACVYKYSILCLSWAISNCWSLMNVPCSQPDNTKAVSRSTTIVCGWCTLRQAHTIKMTDCNRYSCLCVVGADCDWSCGICLCPHAGYTRTYWIVYDVGAWRSHWIMNGNARKAHQKPYALVSV